MRRLVAARLLRSDHKIERHLKNFCCLSEKIVIRIRNDRKFVTRFVLGDADLPDFGQELTDYKTALQEKAQALKLPQPRYSIIEERGPEHAKTFLVEVRVGRDWSSRAEGLSKKSASQKAAQGVLEQLNAR